MKFVYDTNVLIDALKGHAEAMHLLAQDQNPFISRITWMETMVGARTEEEVEACRCFLNTFTVLAITEEIAERAVLIRRSSRIKIPDAVIWATALQHGATLVTLNTKDFPRDHATIMVPYEG